MRKHEKFADFILSDGRKAVIRKGHGYDLFHAGLLAGDDFNTAPHWLLVELLTIDGKQVESVLELEALEMTDVLSLMELVEAQMVKLPKS